MTGVSVGQLLAGAIPRPTYWLRWGEDMPAEVMEALRRGETAMLHDADGNPCSLVLMDSYGQIREKRMGAAEGKIE